MVKTGSSQNNYWTKYYENDDGATAPSAFCTFVCQKIDFSQKNILELCSGNGRDTRELSKYCKHITAVDYAVRPSSRDNISFIKSDIVQFLHSNSSKDFDYVYCRFGLHSVEEHVENLILEYSNRIVFEFRSDKDTSFRDDHFRRTINGNAFLQKLIERNFEISYFVESNGLAVYEAQDPTIIRVLANKKDIK